MKAQELKIKNKEELNRMLQEKRVELCQARFDIKANQLKDNQLQKRLKKDIARILTVLNATEEKESK